MINVYYLSGAQTNHQISDESVLRLTGAVAHHHPPAVLLSQFAPEKQADSLAVISMYLSVW